MHMLTHTMAPSRTVHYALVLLFANSVFELNTMLSTNAHPMHLQHLFVIKDWGKQIHNHICACIPLAATKNMANMRIMTSPHGQPAT